MKVGSVNILVVFALLGLIAAPAVLVGTGATDQLFPGQDPNITIQAADGPNGEYVETTSGENVTLDLSGADMTGVNANAHTRINNVFTITNTDQRDLKVWINDVGRYDEAVTILSEDGVQIESNRSAVSLSPGQTLQVSLVINTATIEPNARLIRTLSVHTLSRRSAETVTPPTPTPTATPTTTATPTPTSTPTTTQTSTRTPTATSTNNQTSTPTATNTPPWTSTPTPDSEPKVEVVINTTTAGDEDTASGSGSESETENITVNPMSMEDIQTIETNTTTKDPKAVIDPQENGLSSRSATSSGLDPEDGPELDDQVVVTQVNKSMRLSGGRTVVRTVDGVSREERVTSAVNIQVPENMRNESATIQMSVDRDTLQSANASSAVIGHRTKDGWQLLDTKIIDRTDDEVILRARTSGFSPFAVFVNPEVEYTWKLPDGSTESGRTLEHTFEQPGVYDVELTVTDALGRKDTTTRTIIANDVPRGPIEFIGQNATSDGVTIATTVENEIGNVSVTWTLPGGEKRTGKRVTHPLPMGKHTIELYIEDEYGASSTVERTIIVGPEGVHDVTSPIRSYRAAGFPIGISILALLSVLVGYRLLPWRIVKRKMTPGPKIETIGEPLENVADGCVGLRQLSIVDQHSELDTIIIELLDTDDEIVVRKQISVGNTNEYDRTPEVVALPPKVELVPRERYVFHVRAINAEGQSDEEHGRPFSLPDWRDAPSPDRNPISGTAIGKGNFSESNAD